MTAMCVALDPENGRATVVGAGHPPLLVVRAQGGTEAFSSSAPPLGLVERSEFVANEVDLEPGDAFLLYTDGLFGVEHGQAPRLTPATLAALLQPGAPSAEALLAQVFAEVTRGDGDEPLPDDVAAIAVMHSR